MTTPVYFSLSFGAVVLTMRTSNAFAILGLRALYFLLAGAMGMFRYLNAGLAAILCFVGTTMLVSGWYIGSWKGKHLLLRCI